MSDSNTRIPIGTGESNINDINDNKSDSFCIVPEGQDTHLCIYLHDLSSMIVSKLSAFLVGICHIRHYVRSHNHNHISSIVVS